MMTINEDDVGGVPKQKRERKVTAFSADGRAVILRGESEGAGDIFFVGKMDGKTLYVNLVDGRATYENPLNSARPKSGTSFLLS